MAADESDGDQAQSFVSLTKGTKISHYRIIEKIGAGGMGEVYLAEDTNLNRQIAIKVLPDMFGSDQERLARFEREAKLLASLNHPNLATIHGLDDVQGKRLLVMELVEGETLAERIAKGPLPIDEALEIFRQIAAGMESAHEKGIIHRDLKPANIKITPEGKVKILDFGLAKVLQGASVAYDPSNSPTITENMTRAGVILGTAAYMSPEQAKGKAVDKRTDIWAFGCIAYECLTGRRAFEGETTSETLAAILRGEPDWDKLPTQTPSHIRALLHRCLQKDATQRLRDIGDARIEVGDSSFDTFAISETRGRSWRELSGWAVAVLAVAVVTILWITSGGRQATIEEPIISHILPPENSVSCFLDGFALSPDGRKLAFVSLSSKGERLLWVRSFDRHDAVPLTGTDNADHPFWSPDNKQIAFFSGGQLKRVPAEGGLVHVLCRSSSGRWGGSWGNNGVILFAGESGIFRVSEAGGEPGQIIVDGKFPVFLPDGQRILYIKYEGTKSSVHISAPDQPETDRKINGTDGVGRVEWAAPDQLVLCNRLERTVVTQHVDLEAGSTRGNPEPLAERVPLMSDWPAFSVSGAGVIAYIVNPLEARNGQASRLIWVDREGHQSGYLGDIGQYWYLSISPDGRRVAVTPDDDIWIADVASGLPTRFTNEMAVGSQAEIPVWSPQSDRIIADVWNPTAITLKEYALSGGPGQTIYQDSCNTYSTADWSPDGNSLTIDFVKRDEYFADIMYWDFATKQLKPFLVTPACEYDGHFSPDGRWIAYSSNETGSYEIYIRSFPDGVHFKRVSYAGGMHPRWRADGRELFFLGPGWKVMAVEMELEPELKIGTPTPLFQMVMADILKGYVSPYDVSPDGQRFLVISPQTRPIPLTLVQHWTGLLTGDR